MGTYGAEGANGATGYSPRVAGFVLSEAKARGGEEGFLTKSREEQRGVAKLKKEQDRVLLAEGFTPVRGDLWRRDDIYFGREAALQYAYDESGKRPQDKAF